MVMIKVLVKELLKELMKESVNPGKKKRLVMSTNYLTESFEFYLCRIYILRKNSRLTAERVDM